MEAILYAEIYVICLIVGLLLLFWTYRNDTVSTSELWLKRMLLCFVINFLSNFLFTLFNRILVWESVVLPLSYLFKTLYFMSLVGGVICWCLYAESTIGSRAFERKRNRVLTIIPLIIAWLMPVVNLFTNWMFEFGENYSYQRNFLFQVEMWFLFVCSSICSIRLIQQTRRESDVIRIGHFFLTASFPLCLLAAALLTYIGESFPVICVCIMVELLCLHMGNTRQQISVDKLTQVNNRQNLIGFLNYKLKNHEGDLYLLMIDLDYFKQINDIYGHLEGDQALILVSGILKQACVPFSRRPYIARYGGDEFIIIMEGSEEDVQILCGNIRSLLAERNSRQERYQIQLSIGCARWQPGMHQKELIGAADTELYKIKHARENQPAT